MNLHEKKKKLPEPQPYIFLLLTDKMKDNNVRSQSLNLIKASIKIEKINID